jgi:UPF0755 protein
MKRLVAIIVVIGLIGFGVSRGMDWWSFNVETPVSSASHAVKFHVDQGETASDIGTALAAQNLIRSTIAFDLYTRVTNAAPKFEAGDFVLNTNMNMSQIVNTLQHGSSQQQVVTFPEGFPLREQAKVIDGKKLGTAPNYFTSAQYLQAAKNPSWAAQYGFLPAHPGNPAAPYEGYLFPDTYAIDPAAGVNGLIKQQLDQFATVFSPTLRARIALATSSRPAETVEAIVILASMVDREANTSTDRGKVCSVYYNRLRQGIPLGVDATLLYGLGRLSPEPNFQELQLNSPYNTRTHGGLPPSPIGNPGQAALLACVDPPSTQYLFYFADRQGVTHFETNDADFESDKAKYGVSGS